MYMPELHCSKCNGIFMVGFYKNGLCPNDGTVLDLEWKTVGLKPEKE